MLKIDIADNAIANIQQIDTPPIPDDRRARSIKILRKWVPEWNEGGEPTAALATAALLRILITTREEPAEVRKLGNVCLMTGHLGAGGAELQLMRTARMLSSLAITGQRSAGVEMAGSVHVVVKSLEPEKDRNLAFHLPKLEKKSIPVWRLNKMPEVDLDDFGLPHKDIQDLLWLLHPNIVNGLRMIPWFKEHAIEVAYIWQDNPILHFAIAALLAGVPRIVLNFRSMPPNLRWNQDLDQFEVLYKGLAAMPGVSFATNSKVAGQAYATWIGCENKVFHVIRNAAAAHSAHPPAREIEAWENFERSTGDSTVTIGGIFRMHPNKRPLEWIRFAQHYLAIHPRARFVMIGTGMLTAAVRELARELGILPRLLLMRETVAGTYWLRKMDVFVLLSRFEGTPNVLLEAQLAGVPVVSTPVANAKDTFIDGITGLVTSQGEHLDIEDVVAKVDQVLSHGRIGSVVSDQARRLIESRYSPQSMIEHTLRVMAGVN